MTGGEGIVSQYDWGRGDCVTMTGGEGSHVMTGKGGLCRITMTGGQRTHRIVTGEEGSCHIMSGKGGPSLMAGGRRSQPNGLVMAA